MEKKKPEHLSKANLKPPKPPKKTEIGTAGFGDDPNRFKKSAVDAKRGAVFTKTIRAITSAAKDGGGDPNSNALLKSAVERAKSLHIPASNIENAIKKGTGQIPGANYEKITFNAYGPGGVTLIIDGLTDNKNRTTAEIRHILKKYSGRITGMGTTIAPAIIAKIDRSEVKQLQDLLEYLEEHEDVQNVSANYNRQ